MPPASAVLTVAGVRAGYDGRRPVLHGVSLSVGAGEVVAVLGANGSGKSTLVRTALGLVGVSAGEITLFGEPLAKFRDWKRVGYVPQRLGAGSGVPATVREVVSAGRLARRGFLRLPSAADKRAVSAAIEAVGLTAKAGEPVSTLSGGQQQRALIARALAGEPDLLILDEPTAGVDAASQETFALVLKDFVQGGGTVVLVAHELGPLDGVVTRSVVVDQGAIVHDGPTPRQRAAPSEVAA